VFPLVPGDKTPATDNGHLDATSDASQIDAWWSRRPNSNIGLDTEGLIVLDIDAGATWLHDAPEHCLELAVAPLSLTANDGHQYFFRQPAGKMYRCTVGALAVKVDTRAGGGYVVAPPSVLTGQKPYRWSEAGLEEPEQLPLPPDWLVALLDAAESPSEVSSVVANVIPEGQRNETLTRLAGTMRRVGMSQEEISAALLQANSDRCHPPLHDKEVVRIAASVARYEPDQISVAITENHWAQLFAEESPPENDHDPGPIPEELLRVPGFIAELMDHCLATAPYPNVALAFGGALVMLGFLSARRVRDPGDNRTNLYLLALAHSSAGKDWPRKLNREIAHQVGLADGMGERFASGEGIQDALLRSPAMLFQTDEIDGLLQSINKSKDGRYENIMGTLLTLYSSANTVFPMRRKAGEEAPSAIDQPCLSIFGTAIPNHYYAALSERMLTNGLFARMIILESSKRGKGQEPRISPIPERLLETASWWANYFPGAGNLRSTHPVPQIVPQSQAAKAILVEARESAEAEYERCEAGDDAVGTTVWGRVSEQARKLALLYAVSERHQDPEIGRQAASWAVELVMHQTRRMLYMAGTRTSDGEFDQRCRQVLDALTTWRATRGDAWMTYRDLTRQFRWGRRVHDEIRATLLDEERIDTDYLPTTGRPKLVYRLRATTKREPS
jgi:hypothetical protein